MLGYVAYAEDATDQSENKMPVINPINAKLGEMNKQREENRAELQDAMEGIKNEIQAKRGELQQNDAEVKNKIEDQKKEIDQSKNELDNKIQEIKNEGLNKEEANQKINELRNEFQNKREEAKGMIEEMVKNIQENRDQFRLEFQANKEDAQAKIAEMRVKFQENLNNIKNEVKKTATENIVNKIQELNVKMTNNFSDKIDQIETVLVSIESRISKAENNGLDTVAVKAKVEKSKVAIESARTAISTQAGKVYEVDITDEAKLKTEMTTLRNTFSVDMKAINALIKSAHEAVSNTATTLAKIPNIDNVVEETTKVEDTTTNNQ